jgi:hypothetical protein
VIGETGEASGGASPRDGPVVFVSCSREDVEWRRKFVGMIKPVVRQRRLDVWSDERIVVGYEWRPQLEQAIARSRGTTTTPRRIGGPPSMPLSNIRCVGFAAQRRAPRRRLETTSRYLIETIAELEDRSVGFRSLSDGAIDTHIPESRA